MSHSCPFILLVTELSLQVAGMVPPSCMVIAAHSDFKLCLAPSRSSCGDVVDVNDIRLEKKVGCVSAGSWSSCFRNVSRAWLAPNLPLLRVPCMRSMFVLGDPPDSNIRIIAEGWLVFECLGSRG